MSHSSIENLNTRVQQYVNAGVESIDQEIGEFLVDNPASWVGFRTMASVLEYEGDKDAAKECYLGRIPNHVQERFFSENVNELTNQSIHAQHKLVHEATSKNVRSPAIPKTQRFKAYADKNLISRPTGISRFENVSLWFDGFNTVVSNANGAVDESTLIGNVAPAIQASRRTEAKKLSTQVVLMGGKGSNNYYHWMSDILPKFAILESSGIETDSNTKYVFTNVTAKFQKETLKDLGLSADQIYQTKSEGCHISTGELVIPTLSNQMGLTMGSWLPEYLRGRYKVSKSGPRSKKILVTRNASTSHGRGIHNLAEFNEFFISRGYETISPENHTVSEQAALFSQATHVVGAHGAGLTNLLFCQPGTNVYELYGEHLAPCYWAISELSDLNYLNCNCTRSDLGASTTLSAAKTLSERRACSFSVDFSDLDLKHI